MKQLRRFMKKWGLHSFLLPVFFVSHCYIEYYGIVTINLALHVLFFFMIIFACFFGVTFLLTRSIQKSFLITTVAEFIYLFYGYIKRIIVIYLHIPFLAKYIILLPLMIALLIFFIILIVKKNNFSNVNLYLNTLFIFFILSDYIPLVFPHIILSSRQSLYNIASLPQLDNNGEIKDKPDIYYLLFDGYPSPELIKKHESTSSFSLDTFLLNKKFYYVKKSKSNYNNTCFSMCGTLNMQYLEKLETPLHLSTVDYKRAFSDINQSPLFKYFFGQKYRFYNLSIFKIINKPSINKEDFLASPPEDVFYALTLGNCVERDILWNFKRFLPVDQNKIFRGEKKMFAKIRYHNMQVLDSLKKIPFDRNNSPRITYAHFYLPHYPYFYDDSGKAFNDTNVYNRDLWTNDKRFLLYVHYTNTVISSLINDLLKSTSGKAVIIVQSDHGYKGFASADINNYFKNLNAIYFPDQDYSTLNDSLSNVNIFRILLNKYFQQKLPILKDSATELRD